MSVNAFYQTAPPAPPAAAMAVPGSRIKRAEGRSAGPARVPDHQRPMTGAVKIRHFSIDTCHRFDYIAACDSRSSKGPAAQAHRGSGARAVPAGGFAGRSRAALGINLPALRPGREVLAGLGQVWGG